MEKLKSVISHGRGKSVDANQDEPRATTGGLTGEGSHLAGAHQAAKDNTTSATGSNEYHPIYDQFTGKGNTTSGEPIQTTDHAPHDVASGMAGSSEPQSAATATSSLRPGTFGEGASAASIKSGVIGFPQGNNAEHAALGEQKESSHLGRDAALGAGAAGAGGLAAHELGRKPEDASYNAKQTTEPHERSLEQPTTTTDTDRSFPLAGGVRNPRATEKTTTNEREPGTKDKEAGVHDGHGREALAGAAAAATASSALPREEFKRQVDTQPRDTVSESKHHPDALAAATAAASKSRDQEHAHGGHGHTYSGDPCPPEEKPFTSEQPRSGLLFTSGPHATDTANRMDPKLHIPGEFPTPTPQEEPAEPSYLQSKGTTAPTVGGQPELRHTGTLGEPQPRSEDQIEKPTAEHHYGRDAAVASGLGAAGVGAYKAGKHHHKEPTDIGGETFPTESSPYSSTKLDPRVFSKPAGYSEQRYDPTTSESHHGRDAALTGGVLGAGTLAGHEATKPQEKQEQVQPAAGQTQTQPAAQTQPTQPSAQSEDEKSQHHYGRDAALVGAGAGTTAGLYAAQRSNEPDSGPASKTIGPHKSDAANVLDPRVQPNPALQKHHYAGPTAEDPAPSTVGPHRSDLANIMDPRVQPDPQKQKAAPIDQTEQHHHGRDAAVAGGAGAAGYGAYEAAKAYDGHRGTQPGASMNEQRYDPTAPGAHDPAKHPAQHTDAPTQQSQHHYGRDAAVAGGLGAAGAGTYAATREHDNNQQSPITHQQQPATQTTQQPPAYQAYQPTSGASQERTQEPEKSQHHYGRDAAVVGGLGAAGAGVYAANREHNQSQQPLAAQQQYPTSQTAHQPPVSQQHYPSQTAQEPTASQTHQRYDSVQDPNNKHHDKRDAAALGAAGAAAGAGGAYAYSQHDAEKERQAAQKAQEQQLKDQQKEFEKKQKEIEKHQAQEQKQHNKLVAAEDKKHQKEAEKAEKQHQKEIEKEEKKHQKEVEKEEKKQEKEEEGEKKKHHLFGFLHRDKKDKDKTGSPESSPRQSRDSPRHSKEYAGAGVAAGAVGGAAAYEATHDSDSDGKKGGRHRLHKDPPKGHPAREALEQQGQNYPHEPAVPKHMGTDGPIGDVSPEHRIQSGFYSADPLEGQKQTVTEPHTGLPMNVEKYGDGHGGIDGNKNIGGHHQLPEGQEQGGHQGVTDWEAIRKANTPY